MESIKLTYKQLYDLYGNGEHECACNVVDNIYVQTLTGYSKIHKVVCKHDNDIIKIDFHDGDSIECSTEHIFSNDGNQIKADDVIFVDSLYGKKQVLEKTYEGKDTVFDISINSPHWYISNKRSGIIHHNTYFWLTIAKNFLDQDPEARVICFESEGAITKKMLEERDIDGKRFGNIPVKTVQQFKNNCLQCINQYLALPTDRRPKLLIALDSLGMLSTTKEMEDSNDGKDTKDMTRAQIIKAAFRVLTLKLSLANVPMIITNHTYAEMGLYPTQVMSGGGGIKYAASTIVFLSKRKEKDGTEVIGNVIHAKLNKSRIARENMQVDTMLHYTKGLNKYYGLDELALECGVFKKSGTRIELPDGTKLFSKAILANPAKYFTSDVMEKIEEYVQQKFSYGSTTFEPTDDTL